MSSSITTSIPTGIISNGPTWCIRDIYKFGPDHPPYKRNECGGDGNSTQPQPQPGDFLTICCDGKILDFTQDMYKYALRNKGVRSYPLDLANLVCCREAGARQMGGIGPFPDPTRCDAALTVTPLASLAATNTRNAAPYLATFESGRWDDKISANVDWIRTETPNCLWIETTHPEVTGKLVQVEVPAARITTLPIAITDAAGETMGFVDTEGRTSWLTTAATRTGSRTSTGTAKASTTGSFAGRKGVGLMGLGAACLLAALLVM